MELSRLDALSRESLCVAQSLAVRRGHSEVGPEHLLLALLRDPDSLSSLLLQEQGGRPDEVRSALASQLERALPDYSRATKLATELVAVLDAAEKTADARGSGTVTPRHLLVGLLEGRSTTGVALPELGVKRGRLLDTPPPGISPATDRGVRSALGPLRDLTAEAAAGSLHTIVGRDDVLSRLCELLVRGTHHPVLLGDAGVGKSAVVEALAQALASGEAPTSLRGSRLFAVHSSFLDDDPMALVQRWRGSGSRSLLYVEDSRLLAQSIRAFRESSALQDVTFIGCATQGDYYGSLSRQPYLEGSLTTVLVEPLSVSTTRLVLHSLRSKLEREGNVHLGDDALGMAAELSGRFLRDTKLPGAAVTLLSNVVATRRRELDRPPEELERMEAKVLDLQSQRGRSARTEAELAELRTAAGWLRARWEQEKEAHERLRVLRRQLELDDSERLRRRLQEAEQALPDEQTRLVPGPVTSEDVARLVEKRSGVHLGGLLLNASKTLRALERNLGNDVLGQREAVCAIASTLMSAAAKLGPSRGAGVSFWFVGAPGVGKGEAARSLARHFLHDEGALVTVRNDDVTGLLNAVERRARAVILMREVDRATSDVVRLLGLVLEDGVVRARGRSFDFRQAIVILTSREERAGWLSTRVGAVVKFAPLGREILTLLVDRRCRQLSDQLAARGVELEWTVPSVEWLAERGWNREEGLHRLHRTVADAIGAPLGRMLVLGELGEGSRASVVLREGRLEISTSSASSNRDSRQSARERSQLPA